MSVESSRRGVVRLSRGEIESLCLLAVVGEGGKSVAEISDALGLSSSVHGAVEEAVRELAASGLVAVADGRVSLAQAGLDWQKSRADEAGLTSQR